MATMATLQLCLMFAVVLLLHSLFPDCPDRDHHPHPQRRRHRRHFCLICLFCEVRRTFETLLCINPKCSSAGMCFCAVSLQLFTCFDRLKDLWMVTMGNYPKPKILLLNQTEERVNPPMIYLCSTTLNPRWFPLSPKRVFLFLLQVLKLVQPDLSEVHIEPLEPVDKLWSVWRSWTPRVSSPCFHGNATLCVQAVGVCNHSWRSPVLLLRWNPGIAAPVRQRPKLVQRRCWILQL